MIWPKWCPKNVADVSVRCPAQLIEGRDGPGTNRAPTCPGGHRDVGRGTLLGRQHPRRHRLHGHRQPAAPASGTRRPVTRHAALHKHLAVIIDSRGGLEMDELRSAMDELAREGVLTRVVFLDAEDDVIVSRYEENKRPHPLGLCHHLRGDQRRTGVARRPAGDGRCDRRHLESQCARAAGAAQRPVQRRRDDQADAGLDQVVRLQTRHPSRHRPPSRRALPAQPILGARVARPQGNR